MGSEGRIRVGFRMSHPREALVQPLQTTPPCWLPRGPRENGVGEAGQGLSVSLPGSPSPAGPRVGGRLHLWPECHLCGQQSPGAPPSWGASSQSPGMGTEVGTHR